MTLSSTANDAMAFVASILFELLFSTAELLSMPDLCETDKSSDGASVSFIAEE